MSRVQHIDDNEFHTIPLHTVESHWRNVFNQFDHNGDGKVSLANLSRELALDNHHIPPHVVHSIIERADENQDGYITFDEFIQFVESTPVAHTLFSMRLNSYVKTFVPKSRRYRDSIDGAYEAQYTCFPPPFFMLFISLLEISVYLYDVITAKDPLSSDAYGFVLFVYNPHRRAEIWRFITYMLIHSNEMHLIVNLSVQILLGVPLEMVHKWWRILVIYFAGIISGSLLTSISDPSVYLAGASGGVYAIMTAHIATIVMNWTEMDYPLIQLLIFVTLGLLDVGNAVYYRYIAGIDTRVGYAAHLAGALAGFLVGVYVLKNLKVRQWENVLWWICFTLFLIFVIVAIAWNILFPGYFSQQYKFGQY